MRTRNLRHGNAAHGAPYQFQTGQLPNSTKTF